MVGLEKSHYFYWIQKAFRFKRVHNLLSTFFFSFSILLNHILFYFCIFDTFYSCNYFHFCFANFVLFIPASFFMFPLFHIKQINTIDQNNIESCIDGFTHILMKNSHNLTNLDFHIKMNGLNFFLVSMEVHFWKETYS